MGGGVMVGRLMGGGGETAGGGGAIREGVIVFRPEGIGGGQCWNPADTVPVTGRIILVLRADVECGNCWEEQAIGWEKWTGCWEIEGVASSTSKLTQT
jgi:hypothetical protein